MERFMYEGDVYVRPVGRGVVLEETKSDLVEEIERLVDTLSAAVGKVACGSSWRSSKLKQASSS
jgi:hypothetical protein